MTSQIPPSSNEITIYTTSWCSWCERAKSLLAAKGLTYTDVNIEEWDEPRSRLEQLSGRRSVPQIFIGDTHIGGFDDLTALDADGSLDLMVTAAGIGV